ncbi:MAG: class I SAM-dependent methyltransferase [Oscillospiraceae bacterium]|nr:class I SAM-dependent methyltransferase [Oscillospiraceae bacterium]
MERRDTILAENREYWTGRAPGYSEVNKLELATAQRQRWEDCLREELARQFPARPLAELQVLEVGTGPGFFAILLRELGCAVTAIDLTPAMLAEAKENAGKLADEICFLEMDAEALTFADGSFDAVISRNLTWNLPHPDKAYAQWARVLRPGGLLLDFDANWYAYLFDAEAQAAYDRDRANSAQQGVWDQNVEAEGEDFDVMEDIARRVPLSGIRRPAWDLEQLSSLGLRAEADEQVWQRVWSDEEKVSFASTPLFLVRGKKRPFQAPSRPPLEEQPSGAHPADRTSVDAHGGISEERGEGRPLPCSLHRSRQIGIL